MKTIPPLRLIPLILSVVALPVNAAEKPTPAPARIHADLPDAAPQPPAAPKPAFIVKPKDILSSQIHSQNGHTLTVREIKPIALPTPLKPAPPALDSPAVQQRLATLEDSAESHLLLLGASIFRSGNTTLGSLVTLQPSGNGPAVTFWSSADFVLLSGLTTFTGTDGIERSLILSWSIEKTTSRAALTTTLNTSYGFSKIPPLPPGKAAFTLLTEQPDTATLTAIQSLHEIYQNERPRLQAAYASREKSRLAQEANHRAHPPQPKNLILNHWKIEKSTPTPTQGGAP